MNKLRHNSHERLGCHGFHISSFLPYFKNIPLVAETSDHSAMKAQRKKPTGPKLNRDILCGVRPQEVPERTSGSLSNEKDHSAKLWYKTRDICQSGLLLCSGVFFLFRDGYSHLCGRRPVVLSCQEVRERTHRWSWRCGWEVPGR